MFFLFCRNNFFYWIMVTLLPRTRSTLGLMLKVRVNSFKNVSTILMISDGIVSQQPDLFVQSN